jgi:hypothetical protein
MALEIFIPNTPSDTLNLNSVELVFNPNCDEQSGEAFVDELISLATKYENVVLSSITFKENK